MAKIYYRLIHNGNIGINDVSEQWRAATQALLDLDPPIVI